MTKETSIQLFLDVLELSKKREFVMAVYEIVEGCKVRRVIKDFEKEIEDTKKYGFERENSEIIDWVVIRNWNKNRVGKY